MIINNYEAETEEAALEKAYTELNVTKEDILYRKEEIKGGLFKKSGIKLEVYSLSSIADYIKEYLTKLLKGMDIETTFETKIRNGQIQIKMYSDRNSILIGKNGKTLESIQIILRQNIQNEIGMTPYILLDVENYKEKQDMYLERLAKKTAKEVLESKIDVTLEDMNSYERRIVHNALTEYKNLSTASEGEEPNRHIVIRYKGE